MIARGSPTAPPDDLVAAVCTECASLLGWDEVEPHETFFELGGTSVTAVALYQTLIAQHQVDVTLLELLADPSMIGIARVIANADHAPKPGAR